MLARRSLLMIALLSLPASLVACGAEAPDSSADSANVVAVWRPSPFTLQFVGTYASTDKASSIAKIALRMDGKYTVTFRDAKTETGSYRTGSQVKDVPLSFKFFTTGVSFHGTIAAYDSKLTITRDSKSTVLSAVSTVGPNESLCDASGGTWYDDDADPETGLYCVCKSPSKPLYIPSLGGCVAGTQRK